PPRPRSILPWPCSISSTKWTLIEVTQLFVDISNTTDIDLISFAVTQPRRNFSASHPRIKLRPPACTEAHSVPDLKLFPAVRLAARLGRYQNSADDLHETDDVPLPLPSAPFLLHCYRQS